MSQVIFSVGGVLFDAKKEIFEKHRNSFFYPLLHNGMSESNLKEDEVIQIDRKSTVFGFILKYLEFGVDCLKEINEANALETLLMIAIESDFYLLEELGQYVKHVDQCAICSHLFHFEDLFYYNPRGNACVEKQHVFDPKCSNGNYHSSTRFEEFVKNKVFHPANFGPLAKYFTVQGNSGVKNNDSIEESLINFENKTGIVIPSMVKNNLKSWGELQFGLLNVLHGNFFHKDGANKIQIKISTDALTLGRIFEWKLFNPEDFELEDLSFFSEIDGGDDHPERILFEHPDPDTGVDLILLNTKTWHVEILNTYFDNNAKNTEMRFGDWMKHSWEVAAQKCNQILSHPELSKKLLSQLP